MSVLRLLRSLVLSASSKKDIACIFVTKGMLHMYMDELGMPSLYMDKWSDYLYIDGIRVRAWSHPWCEGQTLPFVRYKYEG